MCSRSLHLSSLWCARFGVRAACTCACACCVFDVHVSCCVMLAIHSLVPCVVCAHVSVKCAFGMSCEVMSEATVLVVVCFAISSLLCSVDASCTSCSLCVPQTRHFHRTHTCGNCSCVLWCCGLQKLLCAVCAQFV